MTTLHLKRRDIAAIASGAEDSLIISLTPHGERTIAQAAGLFPTGDDGQDREEAWLRALPDADLIDLSTARMGGATGRELAEVFRRIRERVGPVNQEREVQPRD